MIQNRILKRPFIDCFYVQVENRGQFETQFEITFTYKGKIKRLKTPMIQSYYKAKLCFPTTAINLSLIVKIFKDRENKIVYTGPLQANMNHCFYVTGTLWDPVFIRVEC